MKIETLDIAALSPDPANVRRHPERNLEAIKASLRRFGQQKPIVVGKGGVVIAGNGTLEAAKALGWKTIRAVRTKLTGPEATAYGIADNRTGELATWAEGDLADLLKAYREDGGLDGIGFTTEELDSLVHGADLDRDMAHFGRVGGPETGADAGNAQTAAAAADGAVQPGGAVGTTANVSPADAGELSLVITGPRAVIERLRGLIAEVRRGMIAGRRGFEAYMTKGAMEWWRHIRTADPIYDWSVEDVWLLAHQRGWDYNRAYDIFARLGISPQSARIAPPYGEEPSRNLWMFKKGWPHLWDRMQARVDGADCAARYAKTVLYQYGGTQRPAEGETWRDFTTRLLLLWPPETRRTVSGNIMELIRDHKTRCLRVLGRAEPIPDEQRHRISGVSWQQLAKVAGRGVMKGRTLAQIQGYRG